MRRRLRGCRGTGSCRIKQPCRGVGEKAIRIKPQITGQARGTCRECRKEFAVNKDKKIRFHPKAGAPEVLVALQPVRVEVQASDSGEAICHIAAIQRCDFLFGGKHCRSHKGIKIEVKI